jgi:hypothetical protein
MTGLTTVADVVRRLQLIQRELAPTDGLRHFNRVYLTVTEQVGAALERGGSFRDDAFISRLDVVFAQLWIDAYDAACSGATVPAAWRPLFAVRRSGGRLPLQYALAGMNAHIEHDLPLAVVQTCVETGRTPDTPGVHADYEAVNTLLAAAERGLRRSFLDEVSEMVDAVVDPVVHVVNAWNIDKARDAAWVSTEALWALRPLPRLGARFRSALGHTVGMGSRCLLTPLALPR